VERIVVGTDLGSRSKAAVAMAAELATATGATVHLVTSVAQPAVGMGHEVVLITDPKEPVEAAQRELAVLAKDLQQRGITVETHTPIGDAAEGLCSVAETVDADLIVVGNRRMKGAGRLLGSVPNKVAHHAPCSVLIAKTE
jgi:nucleotide-binding universal stress UspA family protein